MLPNRQPHACLLCLRCSGLQEVRIVRDRNTGDSRGFGFVVMMDERGVKDAVRDLNGADWNGRRLLVEIAKHPR